MKQTVRQIVMAIVAAVLLIPGICAAADKKPAQEPAGSELHKTNRQKFDLNRISREELVGIPGIGPRMAQAILDLRSRKGAFKRVEELLEVAGIKEKKLAAIVEHLEILPPTAAVPVAPVR